MIIVLRNAVVHAEGDCLSVESEHGRWRLCVSGRRASLEAELAEAEFPIDPRVPAHPAEALEVLLSVLAAAQDRGWRGGGQVKIAVAGPPASGKSTLLRRLLGLPPPEGPTAAPEPHRLLLMGAEAAAADLPGGWPAAGADCTVAVVPLDMYLEPPRVSGRVVLVATRPPDRGLLALYADVLRPAAVHVLDPRTAPRWRLAAALADCI